jgi:hypothetical protein
MIKIEKGVPIPRRGNNTKYPWDKLEPGDSFFIAGKKTSQISGSFVSAKRRLGIRLTARAENGGTRIWRLPDDGDSRGV